MYEQNSVSMWGCDLGTTNVSIACLTGGDAYSFYLEFKPDLYPPKIHRLISSFVFRIIDEHDPPHEGKVYIESVFAGLNQRTFSRMTRVAHSLGAAFDLWGYESEFIDNNQWRKVLYGTAKKSKEACQEDAYERWSFLKDYPKKERGHRADSLLIAEAGRKLYLEKAGAIDEQHIRSGPDKPGVD